MMKLDEKQIIQLFIAKLKENNLKDFGQNDVTVIPSQRLRTVSSSHAVVFKCDMLVESTGCTYWNGTMANRQKKHCIGYQ